MRVAIILSALLGTVSPAAAGSAYDHDALGAEFCRLSLAGDLEGLRPMLSRQMNAALDQVAGNPDVPAPDVLFQTYTTPVEACTARTLNAAIVQITRSQPGGGPGWTDYLVVVPESDGITRIDDVLFAIRKSDTLMFRLKAFAARG